MRGLNGKTMMRMLALLLMTVLISGCGAGTGIEVAEDPDRPIEIGFTFD